MGVALVKERGVGINSKNVGPQNKYWVGEGMIGEFRFLLWDKVNQEA